MMQRIFHVLLAIDQCLFVLLTLGAAHPDETASAAAWRLEQEGRWSGRFFRPVIDWTFAHLPFGWAEEDHCRKSFDAERDRRHLPRQYRESRG